VHTAEANRFHFVTQVTVTFPLAKAHVSRSSSDGIMTILTGNAKILSTVVVKAMETDS
jgi:hypothetical protein